MQLENSFTVPLPVDEAWRVLLDVEQIAPCMPGAALDSVEGDSFTGRVKVKLGPINLTYQGKGSFVEKDEAAHRAVIDAKGKDQRGNGTAAAVITANLASEGSNTRVDVLTDLNITGRPAQFGRGVMTDVGNKLLGQFADKLAAQLGGGATEAAPQTAAPAKKAAAAAAGAVEEVAASVEQVPGDNAVAKKARKTAASAKKTAAAAADRASTGTAPAPESAAAQAPATQTPASTGTAPAPTDVTPAETAPADVTPAETAPAATGTAPAAEFGAPAPATPTAPTTPAAMPSRPAPAAEPEPIDLLEVAGGAALTRYAPPLAGVAALLLVIAFVVRRLRR
ncbi:carbon monoxide dehydrogenase [Geodermatophilus sp. TF02-6]|uniref:SRPBCC family protein n=1 Tax=Geodermatophilus sp. TF02-6 TaxID=2250575 RepID=UPI000DEB890A|nr:SRPBCC family protein [Geodermatophilus sp. TF02-6]RBY81603.1 carbon monoxide dehydrogenase [Geodermatophilus sp. TF02-6]